MESEKEREMKGGIEREKVGRRERDMELGESEEREALLR